MKIDKNDNVIIESLSEMRVIIRALNMAITLRKIDEKERIRRTKGIDAFAKDFNLRSYCNETGDKLTKEVLDEIDCEDEILQTFYKVVPWYK